MSSFRHGQIACFFRLLIFSLLRILIRRHNCDSEVPCLQLAHRQQRLPAWGTPVVRSSYLITGLLLQYSGTTERTSIVHNLWLNTLFYGLRVFREESMNKSCRESYFLGFTPSYTHQVSNEWDIWINTSLNYDEHSLNYAEHCMIFNWI